MAKVTLKVKTPPTGDPKVPTGDAVLLTGNRAPIVKDFDIRDRLADLVGKGNTLSPDDKAAIYGDLVTTLGKDKAQKVMTHAYLFNTRRDVQKLNLEDKLNSFYTVGSNDPDVQALIQKSKSLGYGVKPGFRESVSDISQSLLGRTAPVAAPSVDPEIAKKVRLIISK